MNKIPWLALAIGLLVYLISGSVIAGVAAFAGIQIVVLAFVLLIAAIIAAAQVSK